MTSDGIHKAKKLRPEDYHRLKMAEEARLGKRPHSSNSNDLPDKKKAKMESPLSRQPLPQGGGGGAAFHSRVVATPVPMPSGDKPPLPPPLPPSPLFPSPPPPPPPESR